MTDLNKEDNIDKKNDPTKKDEKKELTLEEKLEDTEEKLLRSLAEIDNQRKRFEKDITLVTATHITIVTDKLFVTAKAEQIPNI